MKLLMHEVLQKVSNAKTKAEKIKLLREYNTQALRSLLIINFDTSVISMLPDGDVPFKANDAPEGTQHTKLEKEARLLLHFLKVVQTSLRLNVKPCLSRCLKVFIKMKQIFWCLPRIKNLASVGKLLNNV